MPGLYCGLVPSIPTTTLVWLPAQRGFPVVRRFTWDASLPAESPYISEPFLSHELIAADVADALKPLKPTLLAIRGDYAYGDELQGVGVTQLGAVLRFYSYLRGWPVVIVPPPLARRLGRIARRVLPVCDDAALSAGAGTGLQRLQTEAAIVLAHTARCLPRPDGYPRVFRDAVEEFKAGLKLPD